MECAVLHGDCSAAAVEALGWTREAPYEAAESSSLPLEIL
jgi:hypothetical protein